jgi:hypothetical protein
MPKKFFDIIPPSEQLKNETGGDKASEEKIKSVHRPPLKKEVKKKRYFAKVFVALILCLIVGGGFFVVSALSRAEIKIYKTVFSLEGEKDFSVSTKQTGQEEAVLSGMFVEKEYDFSKQFPATGSAIKETKATGVIRIYNNYSSASQSLTKGTRFVSAEGNVFKLIKAETVPGAIVEKGKISPSYVDVQVEAAEAGESYNIGSTTFSIPGFSGGPKYTAFYGKSFADMSGGAKKNALKITREDLDTAEKLSIEGAKQESKAKLEADNPDLFLLDGAGIFKTSEIIFSGKVEQFSDSFKCNLKIKPRWLSFRKKDAEKISTGIISDNIKEKEKIIAGTVATEYVLKSIDLEKGKAELKARVSVKTELELNLAELEYAITGKTISEAKAFLENYPGIEKVELRRFPFWLATMPKSEKDIKIELAPINID